LASAYLMISAAEDPELVSLEVLTPLSVSAYSTPSRYARADTALHASCSRVTGG